MSDAFLKEAAARYVSANAGTLDWMLGRPPLGRGFLNTKLNSLTLADYTPADGLRGPDYTYGWIQGRGLEAIATHAAFFADRQPDLTRRLDQTGARLYRLLKELQSADEHVYFRYDGDMRPVRVEGDGHVVAQTRAGEIFTYSDAFAAKGLIAAAHRHQPEDLPGHLDYFNRVVAAVEEGRFQTDEQVELGAAALASQADDFGPRMILLGAAGMLERLGFMRHAAFAEPFIAHVIGRHLDRGSFLLRNAPGDDHCNVGHGIEFAGFALDYTAAAGDRELVELLERILLSSFRYGLAEAGLSLTVSIATGEKLSPYQPWWSLPEAIRTAALAWSLTGNPESLAAWQQADRAFFRHYWRGEPPIAYQTITAEGPMDYVPATPDLDPGYHTGLSLLAAIRVALATGCP
jgi:mannose/cellobiose epimerase-like protein (N-acyl-D-glucosamine 2-epimerase family)